MHVIHPLKPIFNKDSKILILGSMPSKVSREKDFYYAHPQNRFWPIMEKLFNTTLPDKEAKVNFLLSNNIALWDVYREVEIDGSSDTSIKNEKLNDINLIIKNSNIKAIFCTGKKAYEGLIKNTKINIPINYLPSPSSANATFSLEMLIKNYNIILMSLKK